MSEDAKVASLYGVLFAGEHTDKSGTSTVDSAWRTGLREAARLIGSPTIRLSLHPR